MSLPRVATTMFASQNNRSHVAWDIETTGFAWNDEITVSGFWFPAGHADLILNTNATHVDTDRIEEELQTVSGGVPLTVVAADNETELLTSTAQVLFEKFDREYNRLIAFNAEVWKGGFDLPFVRTRCFKNGVNWIFDGIQFVDLWDALKKRINTTHTAYGGSISVNSLTGAHKILFSKPEVPDSVLPDNEEDYSWYREYEYDPFNSSGSAASRYRTEDYLPVLQHNLADVHRTWEIGELIREFVSAKDFNTKKL